MSVELVEAPIGEFINFRNGKTSPDRSEVGEIAVFGSNGIIGYCDKSNAEEGSLIVGRVGSYCGSVYHSQDKCWVTDNAIIGTPIHKEEADFWFFLLKKLDLNSFRAGSGQPLLNQGILNSIRVQIPNCTKTRELIGKHLMLFDDKIELNRQINQTLEQIAQAIFKSWFVDFEPVKAKIEAKAAGSDPEHAAMFAISGKSEPELDQLSPKQYQQLAATAALFPDELVESGLGLIPEGWVASPLGDYLDVLETGRRPKGGVGAFSEGIPSVGAESINGVGNFDYSKTKYIPSAFFEKMKSGLVEDYDVLLYKDGGKPGDFKPRVSLFGEGFPFETFAINEHVFRMRSIRLGQPFLYFQLGYERVLADLRHRGAKAAIPGVNQGDVNSLNFLVPEEKVTEKYNETCGSLLKKILVGANEMQTLATLRDTLLPKLLSGEISVGDCECQA